jgi:hypothetical protein
VNEAISVATGLEWPPETIHIEHLGASRSKGDVPFEFGAGPRARRFGSEQTRQPQTLMKPVWQPPASRSLVHRDSVLAAAERAAGTD